MTSEDVRQRLKELKVGASSVKALTGSFDKQIFLVDDTFVLRPSRTSMAKEQEALGRIANLPNVPKIRASGTWSDQADTHFTLLDQLPGVDYIDAVEGMTEQANRQMGVAVGAFLNTLHALPGPSYDIGHYLPMVPHYTGRWKDGHREYWRLLRTQLAAADLSAEGAREVDQAFAFLDAEQGALEEQHGPVLLHNDFHPKNLIVNQGRFSGVIDWECSQFGEADFDLVHLVHWCLYPPRPEADFRPFLAALWESDAHCLRYHHLAQRLTVYQIEHELIQLIWSHGRAEGDRLPKLRVWLDGGVPALLNNLGGTP